MPQIFSLGPVSFHYYGITMALAVFAGWLVARKRANVYGINLKGADDFIFWLVIGGFVGARVYHVFSSPGYYLTYPADIFKVWNGGLSIYGALFGGVFTILFLSKTYLSGLLYEGKLKVTNLFNWLAPSLVLGQIIGRLGNLFNYEAFGYPTNLPWKMFVPVEFRPMQFLGSGFFHPWFLYEQIGLFGIFFVLLLLEKKRNQNLFLYYLLLYNILRFILEFLRTDSTFLGNFRLNSISSLTLALLAFAGILYINKHHEVS